MDESRLTVGWARIILEMQAVCESEGIGPDSNEILTWIKEHYPELKSEFRQLEIYRE